MKRLAVTVALLVVLAVPATAQAAPFPSRLNFAYSLAIDYWGQTPQACASIDKQIVPAGSLGNPLTGFAISGRATQPATSAPPGSVNCVLLIDRAYAEPIIFDLLCAVMVHNVGHLLGKEHSEDPGDAMHESIPVPELCNVKGRQATRLYMLRMKLHWLKRQKSGDKVDQIRLQTRREVSEEAKRFWSPVS
ncbi:MAG TPA: hypothetical protein VIE64_07685 [Solirubrobacterales bacterium]|jgi:hypothetical protein